MNAIVVTHAAFPTKVVNQRVAMKEAIKCFLLFKNSSLLFG